MPFPLWVFISPFLKVDFSPSRVSQSEVQSRFELRLSFCEIQVEGRIFFRMALLSLWVFISPFVKVDFSPSRVSQSEVQSHFELRLSFCEILVKVNFCLGMGFL